MFSAIEIVQRVRSSTKMKNVYSHRFPFWNVNFLLPAKWIPAVFTDHSGSASVEL